jgi:hypothetical protein
VFAAMLVVFGLVHAGYFTLAQTQAWQHFVGIFRDLPLV